MGLAQLIRSDSEAIRGVVDERAENQVEALREAVDWRMAAFAERIDEKLEQAADQVANRASEAAEVAIEGKMRDHIDDRLTAIARLIRSDNQALAQAFNERQATAVEPVDPELLRQTVRAIKELQAGLADDVQATVETRFQSVSDQLHKETQSTAESMIKVAEVLGDKIDRLSVRVDEGYGNDLQVVIDRMGDAIQAMSTVRRPA